MKPQNPATAGALRALVSNTTRVVSVDHQKFATMNKNRSNSEYKYKTPANN